MTAANLLPADVQQRADAELGSAWRRCEAALPDGWRGPAIEPIYTPHVSAGKIILVDWRASAFADPRFYDLADDAPHQVAIRATPIDALTALAEALEARREEPDPEELHPAAPWNAGGQS